MTPMTVPTSVIGEVMTSSPSPMPAALTAMWMAAVPEEQVWAYLSGHTSETVPARASSAGLSNRRANPARACVEPIAFEVAPATDVRNCGFDGLLAAQQGEFRAGNLSCRGLDHTEAARDHGD